MVRSKNLSKTPKKDSIRRQCTNTAVCQFSTNGQSIRQLGQFKDSSTLRSNGDQVELELHYAKTTTMIEFQCAPDAGSGQPQFAYESNDSTFR